MSFGDGAACALRPTEWPVWTKILDRGYLRGSRHVRRSPESVYRLPSTGAVISSGAELTATALAHEYSRWETYPLELVGTEPGGEDTSVLHRYRSATPMSNAMAEWAVTGIVADNGNNTAGIEVSFPSQEAGQQSTLERFNGALAKWKGLLSPLHEAAVQRYLAFLFGPDADTEEDEADPHLGSFGEMLQFLAEHAWAKRPAFGLDRQGHFSLSWSPTQGAKADTTIVFLNTGQIKWFAYDSRALGQPPKTGSGVVPKAEIMKVLSAYGADMWIRP